MTVIDVRLSSRVEAGFSVAPESMTRVTTLATGHERRNAMWTGKRRRYTSRFSTFNRAEREELLAAVHAAEGQLYAFRFKDWADFSAVGQSLGNAPSGSTAVQLVKTYTFGSQTHTRTITKPRSQGLVVYQAGVAKAGTVDTMTGLFTPTTAWTAGQPLTADFEFDVPVRFATDSVEFVMPHREISQVNCDLVEVFGE